MEPERDSNRRRPFSLAWDDIGEGIPGIILYTVIGAGVYYLILCCDFFLIRWVLWAILWCLALVVLSLLGLSAYMLWGWITNRQDF